MGNLIDITLTSAYRIGGQIKTIGSTAEVAQCLADDLIARNKAHKTKAKKKTKKTAKNESTEANSNSDGGE